MCNINTFQNSYNRTINKLFCFNLLFYLYLQTEIFFNFVLSSVKIFPLQ